MAEVEATLIEIETMMDFGAGRSALLRAFPEIPPRTMDDYIRRSNERALEENAEQREQRRARALRRNYAQLRELQEDLAVVLGKVEARKAEKDPRRAPALYHAIARTEDRIAKMEGTFAPEVIKLIRTGGFDAMSDEQLAQFGKTGRLPAGFSAEDVSRHN